MNRQNPPGGIEWTRIQNHDGSYRKGYTWNPISGCRHGCSWRMPDGMLAECYAKTTAEGVASSAYPDGFETVRWHPERLDEPLRIKEGAGIFLDSMSDLMQHTVREEYIRQVLSVCAAAPQHVFFLLTKNPRRLLSFSPFPPNVWVGVSSPPDYMFGHALSHTQKSHMLEIALHTLRELDCAVRWMSFEPLSWDCASLVEYIPKALDWCVIGAASNGRTYHAPDSTVFRKLLEVLDCQQVPIFFKNNLRCLPQAVEAWRAEFPL